MKNQRQRRPLQDETRTGKKTVRERAQISKRQRDRIEENRDRREQRREDERLRRQTVDSVRSPKEDVRTDRFDSRLIPVEDTFLGRPVGSPTDLPVLIGERWALDTTNATVADTEETVVWDTAVFTTERNGYPALYDGAGNFRIPAGLAGVWRITVQVKWSIASDVISTLACRLNASTYIGQLSQITHSVWAQGIVTVALLQEADLVDIRVTGSTSAGEIRGDTDQSYVFFEFLGK